MRDELALVSADTEKFIGMYPELFPTVEEKAAARRGYRTGHTAGFNGGWTQGYDEGVGIAGWKAKAQDYLIPVVIAGAMLGWVACWLLFVAK